MKSYTVIDLFCGCGGASLGVKLAGHRVVAAVDIDPVACKTYSENLNLIPMCRDLRFLDGHRILEFYGLKKDDVDLMIGCPPCQGFSSLRRTRYPKGDDPRKGLVNVFIKRVSEIQPRAVIFENVPGIARKIGIRYLKKFLSRMEKMGYKTIHGTVNTADYGVPQFRKRVIALCVKSKGKPSMPQKTHGNPQKLENGSRPWKTVREAIDDLPPLKPGETCPYIPNHYARNHSPKVLKLISKIPKNGGSRASLPKDSWLPCHLKLSENKSRGAESVYGRISWDRPSPTITCRCTTPSSGRFVHPEQDRAITPREAARLQSFPDNFVFPEGFSASERLIGNAVPPLLISTLLEGFEEQL
jgi:DNA (cytosine-5)-methyltransferase 1